MGPNSLQRYLYRRNATQKRICNVATEAEFGVIWPQTKECQKQPKGGKDESLESP